MASEEYIVLPLSGVLFRLAGVLFSLARVLLRLDYKYVLTGGHLDTQLVKK